MNRYRLSGIILLCVFFFCCNVSAGSREQQLSSFIEKYGKNDIIDFILKKSPENRITVQVGKKLYLKGGRPSTEYVSVYSVDNDLRRLGLNVKQAEHLITEFVERKAAAAEKRRAENEAWKQQMFPEFNKVENNFKTTVNALFPINLIKNIKFDAGVGEIIFKKKNDYFGTGDMANKIHAIESTRIFMGIKELERLKIVIPVFDKARILDITRKTIEEYYQIHFNDLKGNADEWKNKFARKYDSKKLRRKFAAGFVKVKLLE